MKINDKILHIPPYISTSWTQVRAIYLKNTDLVICLNAGTVIDIPNLNPQTLEVIFTAHSHFLEGQQSPPQGLQEQQPSPFYLSHAKGNPLFNTIKPASETDADAALSFGFGTFDSFGSALHHNASQSNMPDLPKEILTKISAIAKIVAPDDLEVVPKPEPHCNCTHCQIAKAVLQGLTGEVEITASAATQPEIEEEITEADLTFQQWDISQSGDNLFSVSSRLDPKEKYNVFLGNPVGCTCGKPGCEHILAVLKS